MFSSVQFNSYPVPTKPSLDSISLKQCINASIGRMKNSYMRPNTIALITATSCPKNILSKGGSIPRSRPIKYLISAENKDNAIQWEQHLNRALNGVRLWDTDSAKPYSPEEFEKLLIDLD